MRPVNINGLPISWFGQQLKIILLATPGGHVAFQPEAFESLGLLAVSLWIKPEEAMVLSIFVYSCTDINVSLSVSNQNTLLPASLGGHVALQPVNSG